MALSVGDRGTAVTPLHPNGFVWIDGAKHDARAEHGTIPADADVVVVGGDHLGLIVRTAERGRSLPLPDHGKPVCTSFDARLATEEEKREAERREWLAAHRRTGTTAAVVAGVVASATAAWALWGLLGQWGGDPWAVATLVVLAGGLFGVAAFRGLDEVFGQIDPNLRRVSPASAVLAVLSTFGGAAACGASLGPVGALAVGLVVALFLAAVPPLLITLAGLGGGE